MKYANPEDLARSMISECERNHSYLQLFAGEVQGSEMSKIFDAHDVVFAVYFDAALPGRAGLIYIKGSYEDLKAQENVDDDLSRTTAFGVRGEAEAKAFAEIYECRQAEIAYAGKPSLHMEVFWNRLTPEGYSFTFTPSGSPSVLARDWNAAMGFRPRFIRLEPSA